MNITFRLLAVLVLVSLATPGAFAADARARAHQGTHGAQDRGAAAPIRSAPRVTGAEYVGQRPPPTDRRVPGSPATPERPAPTGARGTARVDGTAIRATTHADINGTRIRPDTPSVSGISMGARR